MCIWSFIYDEVYILYSPASLVAQTINNLPANQMTLVWSLGWEDPLEKEMATHSSILAWKIPWAEEPCGLQSMGLERVGHNRTTDTLTFRGKKESEKVGLKLNIQKTKIMASSPITSWQVDRETMETVTDFIFLGSKITADGDCGHEIKRRLLLGRKAMINLDSIFKSRDITLPTKVHLVKAMVFPMVMYGCESWTIKKAEHQRIDAFELWYWRRLWESLWLQGDPTSPS